MRELSHALWSLVPTLLAFFFMLLGLVPVGVGTGGTIAPLFALTVVYFFAVHRPELFPPWAIFFVGFAQDVISGGPLGLMALMFVAAYAIVLSQRLFLVGKTFSTLWTGFIGVTIVVAVIEWFAASIYYGVPVSATPLVLQVLVTVLAYPPASFILTRLNRRLTVLVPAAV